MILDDVPHRVARLPRSLRQFQRWLNMAVKLAEIDTDMALVRSRKTLEAVLRQVWSSRLPETPIGNRSLNTLLEYLRKENSIPEHIFAIGSTVKDLGNLGAHEGSTTVTNLSLVSRSLHSLLDVLEWYGQEVERGGSTSPADAPLWDALILHAREDAQAVEQLAARLEDDMTDVRRDDWCLGPGDPWSPELGKALAACDHCLICVGLGGNGPWQNEHVCAEIDRRIEAGQLTVVPVLLPGARLPSKVRVPEFLRVTPWVKFADSLDDDSAYQELKYRVAGSEYRTRRNAVLEPCESPYLGLRHFDVKHASLFFGREARVQWLLEAIRPPRERTHGIRFLALVGASGSGKSSLARAGLIAALHNGGLPGSERWPIVICQPGYEPLLNLAAALDTCPEIEGLREDVVDLARRLGEDKTRLHAIAVRALLADRESRLVVLVDQFEEVFTECQNPDQKRAFIDNLCHAATVEGGRTIIVLTMRDDFYGRCAEYPDLAAALSGHNDLVVPMSDGELRRAIEQPAELAGGGVRFELTEALVREMKHQPGVLPLLQHVMEQLWRRRSESILTFESYAEIGGLEGALERHADAVFSVLSPDRRRICRQIFIRLTRPGEASEDSRSRIVVEDTKRRVPIQELYPVGEGRADFDDVINYLADERLVTIEGGRDQVETTVEVAHEALIRTWSTLRTWLEEDRESHRIQYELSEAVREWNKYQRKSGYLALGEKLYRLASWADANAARLNFDEQEFLDASLSHLLKECSKADITQFPHTLDEIAPLHHRVDRLLSQTIGSTEAGSRERLFAALALLPNDPSQLPYLTNRMLEGDLSEFRLLAKALRGRKEEASRAFWAVLEDERETPSRRLRAALALADYDPPAEAENTSRWAAVAGPVSEQLLDSVTYQPAQYPSLVPGLKPARIHLLKHLVPLCCLKELDTYRKTWATRLVGDYAADDPDMLARVIGDADVGQFPMILEALRQHGQSALTSARSILAGVLPSDAPEDEKEALAKRRANIAVALLSLGGDDDVWPVLRHSPDPRARSHLVHRLSTLGADPRKLARHWFEESDLSIRRALLLALGEYAPTAIDASERDRLVAALLETYAGQEDAGLRAAAEWLLRRWGHQERLAETTPRPPAWPRGNWYVNRHGQTMVMIQGRPFRMGSADSDPDRQKNERHHERILTRRFAISATPVTRGQYRAFQEETKAYDIINSEYIRAIVRTDDSPITYVTWFEAARYCNWLSQRDGIPADQWCYLPNGLGEFKDGTRPADGYLTRLGYRLPTEAEWEFACRAGAETRRFYGHGDDLLEHYAWFIENTSGHVLPVGLRKPNDLGLFDMHGHVWTWCNDRFREYGEREEDLEDTTPAGPDHPRVLRGGAYINVPSHLRAACRNYLSVPDYRFHPYGFRVARTCSDGPDPE